MPFPESITCRFLYMLFPEIFTLAFYYMPFPLSTAWRLLAVSVTRRFRPCMHLYTRFPYTPFPRLPFTRAFSPPQPAVSTMIVLQVADWMDVDACQLMHVPKDRNPTKTGFLVQLTGVVWGRAFGVKFCPNTHSCCGNNQAHVCMQNLCLRMMMMMNYEIVPLTSGIYAENFVRGARGLTRSRDIWR